MGRHMAGDNFSSIKVMVVDDDEFSRKFVTRILEAIGVGHVVTAENGVEALSQLAETDADIDIIVCDIEMPEMTGYEFARRVRYGTVPRFKDVPILMLTGYATEKNVQRARTHKIDGFVVKPPSVDVLKVEIRHVLGLRAERRRLTPRPLGR